MSTNAAAAMPTFTPAMGVVAIACATDAIWMEERAKSVGASEVATVIGCNDYESADDLLAVKRSGKPGAFEPRYPEKIRWGNLLEPIIGGEYQARTGRPIIYAGKTLYRNSAFPRMHATPDFLAFDPERGWGVIDCKNVGYSKKGEWREVAPLMYQVQLLAQMAVLGLSWGANAVLIGGQEWKAVETPRNEKFIQFAAERVAEFWRRVEAE